MAEPPKKRPPASDYEIVAALLAGLLIVLGVAGYAEASFSNENYHVLRAVRHYSTLCLFAGVLLALGCWLHQRIKK